MYLFSIILPTYNEKENVPILLDKLNRELEKYHYEIILVDDNSPDGTYDIAKKLESKYPHFSCLCRVKERGLSSAVLTGFSVAKSNFLIVMDADLQHDSSVIPNFIKAYQQGADIVIGSRKVSYSQISKDWPLIRKLLSNLATSLTKIILSIKVTDPMSGFFGITKKVYQETRNKINPRGFKILLEFLVKAKKLNGEQKNPINIMEIGYTFLKRQHGESKLSFNIIVEYLTALYDLRLGHLIPIYFIKYSIVGLSGVFVNQFTLWLLQNFSLINKQVSLALAIEVSIIYNYFCNNYFTFKESKITGFTSNMIGLLKFNLICLIGAVIHYSTTTHIHNLYFVNIYLANLLGIVLATFWNYLININITWKR